MSSGVGCIVCFTVVCVVCFRQDEPEPSNQGAGADEAEDEGDDVVEKSLPSGLFGSAEADDDDAKPSGGALSLFKRKKPLAGDE